jgi:Arc/MetJ family transcription regulator
MNGELKVRTTLDLPEDLLTEVKSLAGTRSKTTAVILALKDFIDRKKIEKLRKLRGSIVVEHDLSELRHSRLAF